MTPEERLTQAERLLETAARYINQHSQSIAIIEDQQRQINSQMSQLVNLFAELAAFTRQNQEENSRIQTEILLIQAENRLIQEEIRRIWQYLLSQSGNGQSST